ncbi:4Fe-4S dicluster domain-containing protein, partial [Salmonella sp. SAL04196]|uniref:4Fe-4S dicluster domain-containing protein n=1 Tax=Salmonella sp. SAL04196 TaxID=3159815 RepID=UPI00397E1BE4
LDHLAAHAPLPAETVPLPTGAPLGAVQVDTGRCTLCMACVGSCPSQALRDNSERPVLSFLERNCVQCGLCLPACPTYARERLETESPRGRIALLRAWALEAAAPTPAGEAHLDHCLCCRRCEAVCPPGVRYGQLLVEGRRRQRKRRGAAWRQRALEALAARPRLLDALLRLYRSLH